MSEPEIELHTKIETPDSKGISEVRELIVHQNVLDAMAGHVSTDTTVEHGGVMLGSVDDKTGSVTITGSIAAVGAVSRVASLTFTHETWDHISEVQEQSFPDTKMVGWYHSHPHFGIFLSDHDLFIHRNFFTEPWQVAYVIDPLLQQEGFFVWEDGDVARLPSWQVISNGGTPQGHLGVQEPARGPAPIAPPPAKKPSGTIVGMIAIGMVALLIGGAAGFAIGDESEPPPRDTTTESAGRAAHAAGPWTLRNEAIRYATPISALGTAPNCPTGGIIQDDLIIKSLDPSGAKSDDATRTRLTEISVATDGSVYKVSGSGKELLATNPAGETAEVPILRLGEKDTADHVAVSPNNKTLVVSTNNGAVYQRKRGKAEDSWPADPEPLVQQIGLTHLAATDDSIYVVAEGELSMHDGTNWQGIQPPLDTVTDIVASGNRIWLYGEGSGQWMVGLLQDHKRPNWPTGFLSQVGPGALIAADQEHLWVSRGLDEKPLRIGVDGTMAFQQRLPKDLTAFAACRNTMWYVTSGQPQTVNQRTIGNRKPQTKKSSGTPGK